MSLPCTEMGSPRPPDPLAGNISPPWYNLLGCLPGGGREKPLIVGGARDGEEGRIWEGLPWAEGGAFSSGAADIDYSISFQVSG